MNIINLKKINSTNDYVKKHMFDLNNLTFVYADRQTSGRGRLERKWVDSGEDNLYLTIVIKPKDNTLENLPNLTQYLSVALCKVLEENYDLTPNIKWPNDVLVNNKKIAGILAEGTTHGGNFQGLALGIGVNLNSTQQQLALIDKPATSLFIETGVFIDRDAFLEKLYNQFCLLYDKFIKDGFPLIKEDYQKRAMFIGKQITINVLGELHSGIAEGVTDNGLLLLKEDLVTNTYYIGDIL